MAAMPALVAGILTTMLGASDAKWTACSTSLSAFRKYVGLVCIDSRPLRPPNRSKVGSSSGAARTENASTIIQASSSSVAVGCSAASCRASARLPAGSFFQTSTTIVGFAVAPTAP